MDYTTEEELLEGVNEELDEMSQEELKATKEEALSDLEECNEKIELYKALMELKEDKNFKLVIEKAYLEEESDRLFKLLTHSNVNQTQSSDFESRLESIRFLNLFIGSEYATGKIAQDFYSANEKLVVTEALLRGLDSAIDIDESEVSK